MIGGHLAVRYMDFVRDIIRSQVFCWLIIIVFSFIFNCFGQVDSVKSSVVNIDPPTITWLGEISGKEFASLNQGISRRLLKLFAGKEQPLLIRPFNMAVNDQGLIYVLDQGSQSIKVINRDKHRITTLPADSKLRFPSPVGICLGTDGQLFWSDSQLEKVYTWKPGQKEIHVFAEGLTLEKPTGIAFLPESQELWVLESQAHRISIIDQQGKLVRRIGKRGVGPKEFNFPIFIWIGKKGLVYVVDSMNFRVQVFRPDGELISVFGEIGDATGYFARPKGIATDYEGHIYVVDALFHTVQIFDLQGRFLANFGLQGRERSQFWLPAGIFIDQYDRIYVADTFNKRIQIFKYTSGEVDEY